MSASVVLTCVVNDLRLASYVPGNPIPARRVFRGANFY